MSRLSKFMELLTGSFNNQEQFEQRKEEGMPFCEHVNTVCNDKILNLPMDFNGMFMIEESIYTTEGRVNHSSHLFLFTEEDDGILLTSYDVPKELGNVFTYTTFPEIDFAQLHPSTKFTPALYREQDGIYEGGSVSMFNPVLKFTLHERFSKDVLEVSETMEVHGKRTFGFDTPVLYKRI